MTDKPLPVDIGVQPESQQYIGKAVRLHVFNSGTVTLKVHAYPVILHGKCVPSADKAVTVTPASFTLKPHTARDAYATVPIAKGNYGVVFAGTPVLAGQKSVAFSAAVGSQITTQGHLTCHGNVAPLAAGVGHGGISVMWIILPIVLLAFLVGWWFRRRAHRAALYINTGVPATVPAAISGGKGHFMGLAPEIRPLGLCGA